MATPARFTATKPKLLNKVSRFAYHKLKRKERNNANKNTRIPSSISRRR